MPIFDIIKLINLYHWQIVKNYEPLATDYQSMKKSGSKVAIIGAGNVGSTIAYTLTLKNAASEIQLIDLHDTKEEAHVLDIADGLCFVETGCVSQADFKDAKNADIIIITAGAKQEKGETRLDLVEKNTGILKSIFKKIGKIKKDAIVIIISNPVDVLAYIAQDITGLPKSQVFGSGTSLDTARLRTKLAEHSKVSAQNVHGFVLGEHGDSEFVGWSTVSVAGIPAKQVKGLTSAKKNQIEKFVRNEAYKIIQGKGSTYFGIGAAATELVEAILYDQHKVLPVSARIKNWNGISDISIGVPAIIGRNGIEAIWPLKLDAQEKKKFKKSADLLKSFVKKVK